jgi:hypothetical protein
MSTAHGGTVSAPRWMPWTGRPGGALPCSANVCLAAIVTTGYLGGAVATHLRIADTARAAIPLVVGIFAWAA